MNKTPAVLYILFATALLYPRFLSADEANVYFSPNGGCQKAVISELNKAHRNIDIAMYYLTSREIARGLITAKGRGVQVRIVLDKSQDKDDYSKSRYLIKKGFEIKYHTGPGLMHNKFAIIDDKVLLTGSFNWTPTAERENEENLLIMTDKELIREYAIRFNYLWKAGRKGEANPEFELKFW